MTTGLVTLCSTVFEVFGSSTDFDMPATFRSRDQITQRLQTFAENYSVSVNIIIIIIIII